MKGQNPNPFEPAILVTVDDLRRLKMEGGDFEKLEMGSGHLLDPALESPSAESNTDSSSSEEPVQSVAPKYRLFSPQSTSDNSAVKNEGTVEEEPDGDGMFVSNPGFGGNAALDYICKKRKPVAAIFVHAGAGYHSHSNEKLHLQACDEAARAGMAKLKQGASAVDAVVEAIKILENNSVTNAGYGSNLCIDGTVECDATVVDYNGRSGAVGACPHIKNPIALADLILQESYKTMALRRIPPILLIGSGACEFAHSHGMALVPNDDMISLNARDRWEKWTEELENANTPTKTPDAILSHPLLRQRDHIAAILTGTYNEGQPDSPHSPPTPVGALTPAETQSATRRHSSDCLTPAKNGPAMATSPSLPPAKRPRLISPPETVHSSQAPLAPRIRSLKVGSSSYYRASGSQFDSAEASRSSACDAKEDGDENVEKDKDTSEKKTAHQELPKDHPEDNINPSKDTNYASPCKDKRDYDDDRINDTVGVIAIDHKGRIAAGSSSGGIGMKHRGRVGPAALVGIGTAVIPADEGDPRMATVAAVTSGTGEHMATALAAHKCAERLYQSTVRGEDGSDVSDGDDDQIMASFVQHDFMAHPGVRRGASRPAIGVMAVKKVVTGYYFYFAHNTESFAVASMSSSDRAPKVVMSRMPDSGLNASRPLTMRGARKIST